MKLLSSVEKFKSDIFRVTEDHAKEPKGGFEIERAIVQHGGSAVILAVDDKKRVLLVRQYRLPVRDYLWELPAGRLDKGETPLQAAKRELKEETGYTAGKWTKLAAFFPSPGYVSERMTIYAATGLTQGEAHPMDDERIETQWLAAKELRKLIDSGKIMDAKTLIGYFMWKRVSKKK
jgi:ADP-ribose pyrophosphatase